MVVELNKGTGKPGEPDKTATQNQPGKPAQGEPNGSIADLKFDDVPENVRELVQKHTATKAKQLQGDYSRKTEDLKNLREKLDEDTKALSGLQRIQDELSADPKLAAAVNKVYYDVKSGKSDKPATVTKDLKMIDRLIKETTNPDDRQSLQDLKDILGDEKKDQVERQTILEEKIKDLEASLKNIASTSKIGLTDKIARDITSLAQSYGTEIVEKYSKELTAYAAKYPHQPIEKILYQVAKEEDIEQAVLKKAELKHQKELEREKGGLEPARVGVTGQIEKPTDKGGRVVLGGEGGFLDKIAQKHNLGRYSKK